MKDEKDSKITKVVEEDVSKVEKIPLKFIPVRENYSTDTSKLQVSNMYVVEMAVHFYCNGLHLAESVETVVF